MWYGIELGKWNRVQKTDPQGYGFLFHHKGDTEEKGASFQQVVLESSGVYIRKKSDTGPYHTLQVNYNFKAFIEVFVVVVCFCTTGNQTQGLTNVR